MDNPNTPEADEKSLNETLLELARKRFKQAADAEIDMRQDFLDDMKFRAGEQWDEQAKRDRTSDGRPCLVINRIPQFVRQISNDQRQNRPSIKVFPVDDHADPDTAKVFQGIIRHIEYNSQADTAYDTAFESTVTGGYGYFRIVTDYYDPSGFEQEILIKRIRNPLSVYVDPSSSEPDGSDMNFCFITEDLTEEEYKAAYPHSSLAASDNVFTSLGDTARDWMQGKKVRVAEYFRKEFKEKKIYLLEGGKIVEELPKGVKALKERTAQIPVIKWCKLNGVEVLEENEWVGQWIPIVKVIGEELEVEGKLIYKGVVRDVKDPQKLYNFTKSTEIETIGQAPRTPFIGVAGQFKNYKEKWATANRKPHPYLEYDNVSLNGVPAPPPQRQNLEPAIQAVAMASREAAEDMKATAGIYDAALGARSNETSGVAITRRNQQAQTSNFHFVDNLTRSMRHAGRILVDLIPKIYDTPRAARIIGEDGEQEIIRINQVFEEAGKPKAHVLSRGKYDVVIETGPSFATKRQEGAQAMLELSAKNPQVMQVAGDIFVKALDIPYATEIAERIKKTLPPGIGDDGQDQPLPPQVKQQMDQMGAMVEQLSKQLHEAHDAMDGKRMELESKERIEMEKIKRDYEITMAQLSSKESLAMLAHEVSRISQQNAASMAATAQPMPQEFEQPQPMEAAQEPTGGFSPGIPMEQP